MKTKTKETIRNSIIYVVLIVVAYFMLFPFTYMITSSLKTPVDTFRYPPKILPRDQKTVSINGYEGELPLFLIESKTDSEKVEYALIEKNIKTGVFAIENTPDITYDRLISEVTPVGGFFKDQKKVEYKGKQVGLWNVDVDGESTIMMKISQTSVGRFVNPKNLKDFIYTNVRLAEPSERLSAHPENYKDVFELQGLFNSLTNTTLITILVVFGQIVTSIMGGYAFARLKFPGRDKLFLLYLGTYMIPFVVLIIPLYQIMQALNWVNTATALVVPWIFTVYGTFLMRQFFLTIPKEIEEACLIDGASRLLMLRKIFIPAIMPGIATLATFSFLYAWNSFLWPLIIIKIGSENMVLTLALSQLQGRSSDKLNLILAGAAVTILPPVLVFISMQKHYLQSIMASGVKG